METLKSIFMSTTKSPVILFAFLSTAKAACDFGSLAPGTTCSAPWEDLRRTVHPTQDVVGKAWVQHKLHKDFSTPEDAQQELTNEIPYILGPGSIPFIVDGHHTLFAVETSGHTGLVVQLQQICDWSFVPEFEFWAQLANHNFMYGPLRVDDRTLPIWDKSWVYSVRGWAGFHPRFIDQLVDDPWRSLASFARKSKNDKCTAAGLNSKCLRAYARVCDAEGSGIPFYEFRWAYFMNAAYLDTSLWDSLAEAEAFRARFDSLPPLEDVSAWQRLGDSLVPLARGAAAGHYTLPHGFLDEFPENLPGYVDGVDTMLPQDSDCKALVCPALTFKE